MKFRCPRALISMLFLPLLLLGQEEGAVRMLDFMPPSDVDKVNAMVPDATVLDGGIRFRVEREGTGPMIKIGDRVETIYTGRLTDGTVFNRKTGRYHTYWFTVGAQPRQIIRGWEMVMPRMQKGGIYTVAIPALYAYREKGRWGQVPPHATVIFEIEVLEVRPKN